VKYLRRTIVGLSSKSGYYNRW